MRHREWVFILFLFSAMVGSWILLNFTPLHHRQELLLWLFHFELFQKIYQGMYSLKNLSSVLIYLYRSWCSMCKQLHRGLSLKNSFQTLLYAFQKILHHFQLIICHSHILIRKAVVLPLTFLQIQAFPKVSIKPYALSHLSKRICQLRDACTSPLMDQFCLSICQIS